MNDMKIVLLFDYILKSDILCNVKKLFLKCVKQCVELYIDE